MILNDLNKLADLIKRDRKALLSHWREQVRQLPSAKHLDTPTLNDHIPTLLDELVTAFYTRAEQTIPDALLEGSSPHHGVQRVQDGFDIEEVVAEYNILRGCVHDLADRHELRLQGKPFHILNRVFDGAIGLAVQSYADQKAREAHCRREEHLAFVVHDLRTPLNAISLAAKVLEMQLPRGNAGPEMTQIWKALSRNVQHLEDLINKVLEANVDLETERGMQLQRRLFDLWPFVESVIHELHPVARTESIKLLNEVPDDLVVYADAGLLRRVFQNLIANAIKYAPHGVIRIGAKELDTEHVVECWVCDNGSGIPPEFLEKVFDKGETDPEKAGGMGLGLAIVKTFTEAHGGQVTVESKDGSGSTFRFTLPNKPRSSETTGLKDAVGS